MCNALSVGKSVCDHMIYNSKVGYSARQIEKRVGVMYFVVLLLAFVRNRHRCARLSNGFVIPFANYGTTGAALQHDCGTAVAVF